MKVLRLTAGSAGGFARYAMTLLIVLPFIAGCVSTALQGKHARKSAPTKSSPVAQPAPSPVVSEKPMASASAPRVTAIPPAPDEPRAVAMPWYPKPNERQRVGAGAGASGRYPASSSAALRQQEQDWDRLADGTVSFNATRRVRHQHPFVAEVLVSSRLGGAELERQLTVPHGATHAVTKLDRYMKAELSYSPSEFKVEPHDADAVQKLVGDFIRWRWTVTALKTGEHGLGFKLYPMETSSPKELPGRVSFEGKITVVANPLLPDQLLSLGPSSAGLASDRTEPMRAGEEALPPSDGRLMQMIRDNAQYLFGTILLPMLVYFGKRYIERRKPEQAAPAQGKDRQSLRMRIRARADRGS